MNSLNENSLDYINLMTTQINLYDKDIQLFVEKNYRTKMNFKGLATFKKNSIELIKIFQPSIQELIPFENFTKWMQNIAYKKNSYSLKSTKLPKVLSSLLDRYFSVSVLIIEKKTAFLKAAFGDGVQDEQGIIKWNVISDSLDKNKSTYPLIINTLKTIEQKEVIEVSEKCRFHRLIMKGLLSFEGSQSDLAIYKTRSNDLQLIDRIFNSYYSQPKMDEASKNQTLKNIKEKCTEVTPYSLITDYLKEEYKKVKKVEVIPVLESEKISYVASLLHSLFKRRTLEVFPELTELFGRKTINNHVLQTIKILGVPSSLLPEESLDPKQIIGEILKASNIQGLTTSLSNKLKVDNASKSIKMINKEAARLRFKFISWVEKIDPEFDLDQFKKKGKYQRKNKSNNEKPNYQPVKKNKYDKRIVTDENGLEDELERKLNNKTVNVSKKRLKNNPKETTNNFELTTHLNKNGESEGFRRYVGSTASSESGNILNNNYISDWDSSALNNRSALSNPGSLGFSQLGNGANFFSTSQNVFNLGQPNHPFNYNNLISNQINFINPIPYQFSSAIPTPLFSARFPNYLENSNQHSSPSFPPHLNSFFNQSASVPINQLENNLGQNNNMLYFRPFSGAETSNLGSSHCHLRQLLYGTDQNNLNQNLTFTNPINQLSNQTSNGLNNPTNRNVPLISSSPYSLFHSAQPIQPNQATQTRENQLGFNIFRGNR